MCKIRVFSALQNLPIVLTYMMMFSLSIWINKYVLSGLNFTYPLAFQGWQTFVSMIGFTIMNRYRIIDITMPAIGWSSIKHIGPYMIFYTFGLYKGSKALTGMHIPIFLSLHNIVFLFQHVAEMWARCLECEKSGVDILTTVVPLTVIAFSTAMILSTSLKEFRGGLFWMILHLISSGILVFLDQLDKAYAETNAVPKQYCCYLFSVITLGPSSFFIGELVKVYNFPLLQVARFYLSFILSGVIACFLGVISLKLDTFQLHWFNLIGVAKITAASLSLLLFEFQIQNTMCKFCSENPAHQKYHYLACPPSKSLPLPYKYKILEENFQHSDRIVSILHNRQEVCTFSKLKQSVQRVTKRIFNKLHLGQIKTVFPEAYHFSLEKKLNVLSGGSSTGDDQLIITPNFDYEEGINRGDVNPLHDQVKKIDVNKEASSSVKKKSFIKMDFQCLTKRRSIFHHSILEITRKHHQEFLANLKPPMHVPSDKIFHWHPHFPLATVPDIPVSPLPEALDNKYLRAKEVYELIKDTADDKVLKAVRDVAEKHSEKHSETKPFDRKSELQTLVQEGVLKGISQDLLEKVRARENIRMERVMTRQPDAQKRLEMLSRLPEMISILRCYFITSQKTTIAIDDVSKKVSDSYQSYITAETAEQHLHLMADLLPEWISIITVSRGSFVKIDKNKDTRIVIEKINHRIKQEII